VKTRFQILLSTATCIAYALDQLKGIMAQMKAGAGPGMEGMPDVNSPEVQEQFAAMGMTPQDAIEKLMKDPELAMVGLYKCRASLPCTVVRGMQAPGQPFNM
jgi:hypothetical protein